MSLRLKKGDMVQVVSGESRGQNGKILKVDTKNSRVIVEGVNMVKRHTKPNQKNQQGGILEKESSIHISNVMLLCEKTNKPTRAGVKVLEDGKKVRFSKKSKELVD